MVKTTSVYHKQHLKLCFAIAHVFLEYFKNLNARKNEMRNNLCIHYAIRKLNFTIVHELFKYFNNSDSWNIVSENFFSLHNCLKLIGKHQDLENQINFLCAATVLKDFLKNASFHDSTRLLSQ